ncbi:MAG: alanine racemase [Hyphomicrobium sp.]|jgi:alanine racemase
MTAPHNPHATGLITVDLGQLKANWRALAGLVAPAECGAVVKADAYGTEAWKAIRALSSAGCKTFFVATADEAASARHHGITDSAFFVLDGLLPGAGESLLAANAIPVVSSLAEIDEWIALGNGKRMPAALQIETGLNRLGMAEAEIDLLAGDKARLDRLDLRLVMSHLASADDPADAKNEAQRATFDRLKVKLPHAMASLAASDGLMLGRSYHYDLVRPGYALYGGQAFRGGRTPVAPIVTVVAKILQVRDVQVGETVGYSGTWRAPRASRIAIIAAGYADGIARALSAPGGQKGGAVSIGGALAPIVGRVSMDLITVDVTDIRPEPRRGDLVTLIGPNVTIEAMGQASGTIGYEVLTRLGPRFQRRFIDEGG